VQNYIKRCMKCQIKKLVRVKTKQKMIITDTPQAPMELVCIDIVGPLPISQENEIVLI